MARVEKLIKKMRNRPNGIRFNEIVKVLESNGYIMVRVSGSHHHFRNENGDVITILSTIRLRRFMWKMF